MNKHAFDDFAQRAAGGISRRGSLLTIGAGGLAAIAGLSLDAAGKDKGKKRRKKNRKKNKGKNDDRCQEQLQQCNDFFAPLCADVSDPEECRETLGACCELLGECDATAFLDCFFDLLEPTGA